MSTCESEWGLFPLNAGYRVWRDGRVESRLRRDIRGGFTNVWLPLKARRHRDGYVVVSLAFGGRRRPFLVHQAVLLTFVGPCPPGMECRHLDGVRTNNRVENLCWGTPRENAEDRRRHGNVARGERHGNAKLTDAQRVAIPREYAAGGVTMAALGSRYGVSAHHVWRLVHGRPGRP